MIKQPTHHRWFFVLVIACLIASSPILAREGADTFSMIFEDVEYTDIFQTLAELGGLSVLVDQSISGRASFTLRDHTLVEALTIISRYGGFQYSVKGSTLIVVPFDEMARYESLELRYRQIRHMDPDAILPALSFLLTPEDLYLQQETGLLVLKGMPSVLDEVDALLNQLDKPQKLTVTGEKHNLLALLERLSESLQVNLIADASLADQPFVFNIRQEDPTTIITRIEEATNVEISLTKDTMIVRLKETVEVVVPERIKLYRLNYAEPEEIVSVLSMFIPAANIQRTVDTVTIRATDRQIEEADLFINEFDLPPQQVLIEAWVHEISRDALRRIGIEWRGVPSFDGGFTIPTLFELEWKPWELFLALKMLEEEGESMLLARPQIATISGKEASIFIGDRIPIPITRRDAEGNVYEEYVEFSAGIELKITPRISKEGDITTSVQPIISNFTQTGSGAPQTRTREALTTVRVTDGQPIIIGGLMQEQTRVDEKSVPLLANLPILGRLFRWTDESSMQTEMVIFLIPRIMN